MSTKRIIKTAAEWLLYAALFAIIVFGTPKALSIALKSEYPIASITSSSMWPALKQGDIVFIRGIAGREEVSQGDIVVFRNEKGFTIHRAVKLGADTLTTRGDANTVDDAPVAYEDLVGKAVTLGSRPLRIPFLGKLSQVIKK